MRTGWGAYGQNGFVPPVALGPRGRRGGARLPAGRERDAPRGSRTPQRVLPRACMHPGARGQRVVPPPPAVPRARRAVSRGRRESHVDAAEVERSFGWPSTLRDGEGAMDEVRCAPARPRQAPLSRRSADRDAHGQQGGRSGSHSPGRARMSSPPRLLRPSAGGEGAAAAQRGFAAALPPGIDPSGAVAAWIRAQAAAEHASADDASYDGVAAAASSPEGSAAGGAEEGVASPHAAADSEQSPPQPGASSPPAPQWAAAYAVHAASERAEQTQRRSEAGPTPEAGGAASRDSAARSAALAAQEAAAAEAARADAAERRCVALARACVLQTTV